MDEKRIIDKKRKKRKITVSKIKRRLLKHLWLTRIGIIVLSLFVFYLISFFILHTLRRTNTFDSLVFIKNFLFTPKSAINSVSGRTNILILGKGGAGHDAPDLTDTLVFTSVLHDNPSIVMISLPRDIWIPEIRAKLNSAYYWGNQKEKGGGIVLAKATVEEVLGQAVHYGLVIDFSGFREVINVLGGVKVDVKNSFIDEKYPIYGKENDDCDGDKEYKCRYETISFTKGEQLMDGETALKFVRSRNAQGDEGTDLARAVRQELVISAIKEKVFDRSVFLSPTKLLKLRKVFINSLETDIPPQAMAVLLRRVIQARNSIQSVVVDENLLENPPKSARYDNLYVFIPKNGDWLDVHLWVDHLLLNSF